MRCSSSVAAGLTLIQQSVWGLKLGMVYLGMHSFTLGKLQHLILLLLTRAAKFTSSSIEFDSGYTPACFCFCAFKACASKTDDEHEVYSQDNKCLLQMVFIVIFLSVWDEICCCGIELH